MTTGSREHRLMPTPKSVVALLQCRVGRYRRLLLAIGLISIASVTCALVFWMWQPLLALLLIVPIVTVFLLTDAIAVQRWQAVVIAEWADGRLPLDGFRDTMLSVKQLPQLTILGLFESLPTNSRLGVDALPSVATRLALAATTVAIARRQIGLSIVTAGLQLVGVGVIATAALGASWQPLLALPVLVAGQRFARWMSTRPPRDWIKRICELQSAGLDAAVFAQLGAKLDWSALTAQAPTRWIGAVGGLSSSAPGAA